MPTVPVVTAIPEGIAVTSQLNSGIVPALRLLLSPPRWTIRQTVAQTLTTSIWSPLAFDSETIDTDVDGVGGHDPVTANTRWTCRYPGTYALSAGVSFAFSAAGMRGCRLTINGSVVNEAGLLTVPNTVASNVTILGVPSVNEYLNQGDYVEVWAYQSTGGNLLTSVTANAAAQPYGSGLWVGV